MGAKHPGFPVNSHLQLFRHGDTAPQGVPDLYRAPDTAKGNSPESSHVNIREAGFI
jgi:hypothetical protein